MKWKPSLYCARLYRKRLQKYAVLQNMNITKHKNCTSEVTGQNRHGRAGKYKMGPRIQNANKISQFLKTHISK